MGRGHRNAPSPQMDDIDHLDSVEDGEHFMRAIIHHLEVQRLKGRHGDQFLSDQGGHWYVKWEWVQARLRTGTEDQ